MAPFPLENSARDRSTSAGDSELAEHERKRPRLDNSQVRDSLTIKENRATMPDASEIDLTTSLSDPHLLPRLQTPPVSSPSTALQMSTLSPTSRVTINTRPMSAQSVVHEPQPIENVDGTHDEIPLAGKDSKGPESPLVVNISDSESSQTISGLADRPISITSSPSPSHDSVAEIDEPNASLSQPIWLDFPFQRSGSLEEVVDLIKQIAHVFEKVGDEDSQFSVLLQGLTPFIQELPNQINGRDFTSIKEDLDFYQNLHILMFGLLRRRQPLPSDVLESDLLQFMGAFAHVAMSMVQIDVSRLRSLEDATSTTETPWLLSLEYLQKLTMTLQLTSSSNLHTALRTSRHANLAEFSARLTIGFLEEDLQKPFGLLSALFNELARTVPPTSNFRTSMLAVVSFYRNLLTAVNVHKVPIDVHERDAVRRAVFGFVFKAHSVLQEAIKKQHSWLTIENTGECVQAYVYLTRITIILFPELADEVFKMARIGTETIEPDEVSELASLAFRLALLKTLIQQGRMELRVWATETMAQELVNVWTSLQRHSGFRSQPMLKLVVDFLRNNEVVSYILGVDSHPQIVSRSFNVIGFLCVSGYWHPQDSDVAWRAILESQDHRSVAAVIEVLKVNLQHLNLDASLYMYEKLHAVPAEKFDSRMLDFAITLLGYTTQKYGRSHDREHQVNLTMIEMCLHLLRESNVPARCSTDISTQIRDEISNFMLVNQQNSTGSWYLDMTEPEREAIRNSICQNVASHNDHATGSVIGMRTILHSLDKLAAGELVARSDYTRLLLDDMVYLSEKFKQGLAGSADALFIQYTVRIDCMFHLVCYIPQSFDSEMHQTLWDNVLTAALPPKIRSYAWTMIANAYRSSGSSNPVLDFVASHFMESLTPSSFDMAVLDFAQASVEYDIRTNLGMVSEVDQCLAMPSMERLWRIMLEAPDQSVEVQASNLIIKLYLDKNLINRSSAASVEKSQAALVDRCIQTVIDSAQQVGSSNHFVDAESPRQETSSPSSKDIQNHEIRLHRSLMLLRNFLDGLKTRPQFKLAPSQVMGAALRSFERRGPPVEIRLKILDHPEIRSETVSWIVGEENTGHELWQFLTNTTGWSQVNFIIGGGRLQIHDSQSTVRDLKIVPSAAIASKALGSTETGVNRAIRCASPVDSKIMHHFGELYALLESQERIAKAIFEFLTMFSSQEDIVAEIKSKSLPATSLLPVEKPFKLLYYATALRSCIEEESYSAEPNVEFLQYTVQTIIAALSHIQSIQARPQLFIAILHGIIETLLLALRAKVPEATSGTYIADPAAFTNNLLQSWSSVQSIKVEDGDRVVKRALSRNFFDVMIEATLHEPRSWQYIDQRDEFGDLLASMILLNTDHDDRQSVRDVILRLTGTSIGKVTTKAEDVRSPRGRFSPVSIQNCLMHLWAHVYPLLPRACEVSSTCSEFLEAAVAVFGTVSKRLEENALVDCFVETKSLLLRQRDTDWSKVPHHEFLPHGLAKILYHCIVNLARNNTVAPDGNSLIQEIYRHFLFPALSESTDASLAVQKAPVLDANTRTALYDVIVALCQSRRSLEIIVDEMVDSAVDKDAFNHQSSNERKALRSEQGYAGLRNLSNTCYLNSLISQLFMNVKFREFIIGINVTNENSQKLVVELATIFANMQSSYEKYANPEEAVESITQYTGEQIDVTVQMDVDEFFNLLFDRLESQIKDSDAREVFKSIYGGQLVQQIKSQECEHVSERLEPFSAVQIEIKGKSGLEEGLAAYVEGEILQGENKYSCTGCGKHVNAVKRACLKEIPDNLIFNLKRFDYDIMTGMRCKVNDEFQFPDKIDMMPYTMDALSSPDHKLAPDVFELVGVIIHSGTAETGHYYSYIRQRPSGRASEDSWVQFNDHEVSKFEPAQLKDMAFGGCDQTFNSLAKFYNGYMLFYQRASSVEAYAQDYPIFDQADQVQIPLPRELDNRIAQENEICFRRYVAQDPSHARFVRQILERMRHLEEKCSATHTLEDELIPTVLDYLHQVSSRWKEAPEFEDTIKLLCGFAKSCTKCALNIMEWFNHGENTMSCILRAWYTLARRQFESLLTTSYTVLSPLRHASKKDDIPLTSRRRRLEDAFSGCLKQIDQHWNQIQRYNRGWESLFGFLHAVAQLGPREAHMLIELGFLERCLEIVWVHNSPNSKATPKAVRVKFNNYLAAREKGRQFNHVSVMDLFAELLSYVSLDQDRSTTGRQAIGLNETESELLGVKTSGSLLWLKKLVAGRNSDSAVEAVVKELCDYPVLQERTADILLTGLLSTKSSVQTAFLFLMPCQVYIQYCSDEGMVSDMITRSLTAVNDTEGVMSSFFLDYVKHLLGLETTVSGCDHHEIVQLIINNLGCWAPPLLMAPNDINRDVRNETVDLLNKLVFRPLNDMNGVENVRASDSHMELIRSLVVESVNYVKNTFLVQTGSQQQRETLFVGQARQMIHVLELCETYFIDDSTDDRDTVSIIQGTIADLERLESNVDADELEGWREQSSDQLSDQSFDMSVTP